LLAVLHTRLKTKTTFTSLSGRVLTFRDDDDDDYEDEHSINNPDVNLLVHWYQSKTSINKDCLKSKPKPDGGESFWDDSKLIANFISISFKHDHLANMMRVYWECVKQSNICTNHAVRCSFYDHPRNGKFSSARSVRSGSARHRLHSANGGNGDTRCVSSSSYPARPPPACGEHRVPVLASLVDSS